MTHPSVELLAARCEEVPRCLEAALAEPLPLVPAALAAATRILVTGVGAAAGPARAFASAAGERARFMPLSTFATRGVVTSSCALVVFSQGLSPNARLALSHAADAAICVVVTAVVPDAAGDARSRALARLSESGVHVLRHGPSSEEGMLLRVIGPQVSMLVGLRLAVALERSRGAEGTPDLPADLPQRVGRAAARACASVESEALFGPLSIVTFEPWGAAVACSHVSKLLEGLSVSAPPTWDLFDLPHGPFQQFYTERRGLLVFGNGDLPAGLRARLGRMLVPERHWLAYLDASLPGLLGTFEHAAALDALIVRALRARPRDLAAWPGHGEDGPLYEIDDPDLCANAAPAGRSG